MLEKDSLNGSIAAVDGEILWARLQGLKDPDKKVVRGMLRCGNTIHGKAFRDGDTGNSLGYTIVFATGEFRDEAWETCIFILCNESTEQGGLEASTL